MKRVQLTLLALLLALAGGVTYLAMRSRQAPVLPRDDDHAAWVSELRCVTCHGPDGESPRDRNHPLGDDCLRCHGMP